MKREEIISAAAKALAGAARGHTVRAAVDGIACAGKTIFADELSEYLEKKGRKVIRASIDGFHNPAAIRHKTGKECPEGYYRNSFNHDALIKELLEPLGPGGSGKYRTEIFDCKTGENINSSFQSAGADEILIFDGIFLLRRELAGQWDYTIRLEADCGVVVERAAIRDKEKFGGGKNAREKFLKRFIPGQKLYEKEIKPAESADMTIDNTFPLEPVIVRQRNKPF
ncbi:MAG: uridine kinase [Candidatus Goldiibacteriota bacterium]